MKRIASSIIFLFLFCNLIQAQEVIDRITTHKGDTIKCKITSINSQSIFFKKKLYGEIDFIAISDVKSYEWASQYILEPVIIKKQEYYPNYYNNRFIIGIGMSEHFSTHYFHSNIILSCHYKGHCVYAGPEYTLFQNRLLEMLEDQFTQYETQYLGINGGYRYYSNSVWKETQIFLQFNFSIYNSIYTKINSIGVKEHKTKWVFENTADAGVSYDFTRKLALYGGAGFGFASLIPHVFIGINYTLTR